MQKIYWLHGQPGCGKTTIAKRLQFWLQTEKKNWRKSVFHIDENTIKELYKTDKPLELIETIAKYIASTGHDVIVSAVTPEIGFRDKLKTENKIVEIYCHTRNKIGKENDIILDYEFPIQNFIDLDTTEDIEKTFNNLVKLLV
jgi:adenylylsulfate kinase-like enzyme